jgi:hypothetical protein
MVLALPLAVFFAVTLSRVLWHRHTSARPMILPYSKQPMLTLKTLQSLRKKA